MGGDQLGPVLTAIAVGCRPADVEVGSPVEALGSAECADEASPPPDEADIIDWPIPFPPERSALTAAYLAFHRGPDAVTGDPVADSVMVPKAIVLHWTAGPTAESAWNTFAPIADDRPGLKEHQRLNLAAHFVVDRDGTIFRLLPETTVGRHTIGLNHLAIGIENVGDDRHWPLTEDQVDADVALVRHLVARHPITHLIGHYEYREMEGHPYFEETDPTFRTQRDDPGPEFMEAVRAELWDLSLSGP